MATSSPSRFFLPPFARDTVSAPEDLWAEPPRSRGTGRYGNRAGPPFGFERRAIAPPPAPPPQELPHVALQPLTEEEVNGIVSRILNGEPPKATGSSLMLVAAKHRASDDDPNAHKAEERQKRRRAYRPQKPDPKLHLPSPKEAAREMRDRMDAAERTIAKHEEDQAAKEKLTPEAMAQAAALVEQARESARRAKLEGEQPLLGGRKKLPAPVEVEVVDEDAAADGAMEAVNVRDVLADAREEVTPARPQRRFGWLFGNDGNAAIEFAFIAPALIFLLLGGLNYGLAALDLQLIRFATESAARCYGLGQCDESSAVTYAQDQSATVGASYSASKQDCGAQVTATFSYSMIQLFSPMTLTAQACYPIQPPGGGGGGGSGG